MPKLPPPPPEVPVERSLDRCAPKFADAVRLTVAGQTKDFPFETLRTAERQTFLYGFGRAYDDGRGVVTNAATQLTSWHGFGLACDIVEKDSTPWDAPATFWNQLGAAAEAEGLTWGGRWHHPDLPHVQWGKCPASPTDADRALFAAEGMAAVWKKYDAV